MLGDCYAVRNACAAIYGKVKFGSYQFEVMSQSNAGDQLSIIRQYE